MLSQQKSQKKVDASFTFIDLFAGIGGMRIAFDHAGGHCVYSSEWNKYSQQTYLANFGEQPEGDITQVDANSIPDHDILVAGFPCQPFSIAGVSKKQSLGRATGFEDKTQGTLFFDVCRILKAKRPKAFMLENVKNLCSHDKGRTFKIIREALEELDYEVFFEILDGQSFVPQHRERILIVGFDRKRYGHGYNYKFRYYAQDTEAGYSGYSGNGCRYQIYAIRQVVGISSKLCRKAQGRWKWIWIWYCPIRWRISYVKRTIL